MPTFSHQLGTHRCMMMGGQRKLELLNSVRLTPWGPKVHPSTLQATVQCRYISKTTCSRSLSAQVDPASMRRRVDRSWQGS
jgi:hypothetical protein